ncbi:unnamed protein product, partial [Brachionus calyciflorus]
MEYVPNNWFNSKHINLENLNHDAHDLLHNGFLFKRQRINKNTINWLCKTGGCSGSVTVNKHDEKITRNIEHEFVIFHKHLSEVELAALNFKKNCKVRSELEPSLSTGKIFHEEQSKIAQETNATYQELAQVLPSYSNIKSTLQKRKKKTLPPLPRALKDLNLDGEFIKTVKDEKFLIYKSRDNKILVFSSPNQLKALAEADHWYADGTFRSSTNFHYQLYIIHAYVNHHMLACCFALMNRRRKKHYIKVLNALKKESKNLNLILNPSYVMTDFELAAINAFKDVFRGINSKGCLFHFCKALTKKISSNEVGLKSELEKNEELIKWFKGVCALALVPLNHSDFIFEKLLKDQPNLSKIERFMDYFVKTYYEGNFPHEMWNHYETEGYPRTNNNLEGYNNKLNRHLSVAHPDIFKAVNKFKEEEVDVSIKLCRALNKEKPPARKKLNILSDALLVNYKKMLENQEISIDTFISSNFVT